MPDHLLGPRGARVRCPNCGQSFVVLREGEEQPAAEVETPASPVAAEEVEVAAEPEPKDHAAPEAAPEAVADDIVARLEARLGARLDAARGRGRVLAELGPELMAAFDEFRSKSGAGASPEVFRAALRARLGVSLEADSR